MSLHRTGLSDYRWCSPRPMSRSRTFQQIIEKAPIFQGPGASYSQCTDLACLGGRKIEILRREDRRRWPIHLSSTFIPGSNENIVQDVRPFVCAGSGVGTAYWSQSGDVLRRDQEATIRLRCREREYTDHGHHWRWGHQKPRFFSGIGVVCVNEIKKVAKKLFDGVLRHKGQYIDVDENHERTIILWDPEGHQALGDGNITSLSSRFFFFMDALLARSLACLLPSFLPITKCRICRSVEVETGQIATLNCCSSLWAFCVLDIYQSTYVPWSDNQTVIRDLLSYRSYNSTATIVHLLTAVSHPHVFINDQLLSQPFLGGLRKFWIGHTNHESSCRSRGRRQPRTRCHRVDAD